MQASRSPSEPLTLHFRGEDLPIPLSRLAAEHAPIEWHHAVLLVLQLIDELAPDRAHPPSGCVPPIEAIALEVSARLRVDLIPGDEPFVRGVVRVLSQLLHAHPGPAPLRLLVLESAANPPSLDEFAHQLDRFERPGRTAALRALYAEAAALPDVEPPPVPGREETDRTPAQRRRTMRLPPRLAYAMIVAVVALGAAAGGVYVVRHYSAGATPPAPTVEAAAGDTPAPASVRHPASHVQSIDLRSDRLRRDEISGPTTGTGGSIPPVSDASATSTLERPPGGPATDMGPEPAPLAPLEPVLKPAPAAVAAAQEPPVYNSTDAGIAEPVLVRPYLPARRHTGIAENALGVLELVVSERGTVESVHLNSPANRFRERWWVFAAKQWQFDPARKDGKPVRFLKRIPLTDLNIEEPQ